MSEVVDVMNLYAKIHKIRQLAQLYINNLRNRSNYFGKFLSAKSDFYRIFVRLSLNIAHFQRIKTVLSIVRKVRKKYGPLENLYIGTIVQKSTEKVRA